MRKIIVTCTAWRTEYLGRVLDGILANNLRGWELYVGMEPGHPKVHALIRSIGFLPVTSWINGYNLGPELNPFVSINRAIVDGADAVLYFDDDMLLSPDALDLCNWYLDQTHLHDPATHVGINLCTKASDPALPNSVTDLETWEGLVSQGNCFTAAQWRNFIRRNWNRYDPTFMDGDGYDWAWTCWAVHLKLKILRPRLSRSQHIGEHGVHGNHQPIFPNVISTQKDTNFFLEPTNPTPTP